ncbi:FKBP-type peptidyl-prolyl cis-trans isomerase [Parvularcula sp. LCG005]|nr:FKBP-type peptidyl-prolyl cis-trans isomerase [Parvularcula sp. LCG005]WOI53637.1 FKBP-type peptidyl-prolyl cis-trans isomerase [Parvularcula sp. LCG005]
MQNPVLRLALLASVSVLAACGGKNDADDEAKAEKVEEAVEEADVNMAVQIPDAPKSPIYELNAKKSAEFIAEQKARDGVRELEEGVLFEVLEEGNGGKTAGPTDVLRFHYKGSVIGGRVFDDSSALPEPLVVESFTEIPIPGVPVALAQMHEGETARVIIAPEQAFGEEGLPGLFEPNETLIFDIQLFEIIGEDEPERRAEVIAEQERLAEEARLEAEAQQNTQREQFEAMVADNREKSQAFLAEMAKKDGVTETESGLLYEVLEDGGQGATPAPTDVVRVHYKGTLPDGTPFDSSYDRGEPTEFPLNRVIPGWTEGVALMNVGDKYRFYIPSDIAYGDRGTPGGPIGPAQALVFEVELLDIK